MATSQLEQYNTISVLAGEDLSAAQFRFVKLSSGAVVKAGAGDPVLGVLLNKPASGEIASVQIGGVATVAVDAAVTVDDKLMSSADGQATTKTGTNNSAGVAMATATTAGEVIAVKLESSDGVAGGGVASFENTAITPGVALALITVDGTDTLTLADGSLPGQEIEILCVAASNSPVSTLTINDAYGSEPTSWVFTTAGQGIKLRWTTTGWKLISLKQMGSETVANAGTANPLCLLHLVSIADTVDFIQGSGVIAGQRSIWCATANSGTPVGTVSGLFYDEDGSADGIDVNFNAAGDSAALEWVGSRWFAYSLVSATVST